jgi:hypothetical protein
MVRARKYMHFDVPALSCERFSETQLLVHIRNIESNVHGNPHKEPTNIHDFVDGNAKGVVPAHRNLVADQTEPHDLSPIPEP